MTAAEFRRIALSLPQTNEAAHMGHPDFRVAGRIFATLGYPRSGWGMVKREALITAWRNRAPKRLAESILDT
jgi:hypothetical protein